MLVTVTNVSGRTINAPALGEDGVALPGGNHPEEATHRTDPLPYPFSHVGSLANSGTVQRAMHPADWRYNRSQMVRGTSTRTAWQQLVQAATVTLTVAAQTGRRDAEELFMTAV
jgi:hypothetical protein